MINVFKVLIFILVLPTVYASGKIEKSIDAPVWSSELKRWFLPISSWNDEAEYLAKGKFYEINPQFSEVDLKKNLLDLYKDSSLQGRPVLTMSTSGLLKDGAMICSWMDKSYPKKIKPYAICGNKYCTEIDSFGVVPDNFLLMEFVEVKQKKPCPYNFNYHVRDTQNSNGAYESRLNIPYKKIDPRGNYLIISSGVDEYFLDIRSCRTNPSFCGFREIKQSQFEKDWKKLQTHIQKKDVSVLNDLIKELLPCVLNKDSKCILEHFATKYEGSEDWLYHQPVVNDELISELKTCLDYKQLLPHTWGTRGIKKICIFEPWSLEPLPPGKKAKLLPLTYPEALGVKNRPMGEITIDPNPQK